MNQHTPISTWVNHSMGIPRRLANADTLDYIRSEGANADPIVFRSMMQRFHGGMNPAARIETARESLALLRVQRRRPILLP